MTVKELREILAKLPDDMQIIDTWRMGLKLCNLQIEKDADRLVIDFEELADHTLKAIPIDEYVNKQ